MTVRAVFPESHTRLGLAERARFGAERALAIKTTSAAHGGTGSRSPHKDIRVQRRVLDPDLR
jgi:hypothetical protein